MKNKIDFHAHVLPGVDHGCLNVEMSKMQFQYAAAAGVDIVVSTSHFYPHLDTVHSFLQKRSKGFEMLRKIELPGMPEVLLAAEVLLCPNLDKLDELTELCVQGTDVILVEMPFSKVFDERLIETLLNIRDKRNMHVILAHVERYDYESMSEIINLGFDAQINASSVCDLFKRKRCMNYVKNNSVVALGTDIHGTKDEYRKFNKAIKIIGSKYDEILDKSNNLLDL